MLALGRYRSRICSCGYHSTLTHDKSNHFTFDVDVCPVCAAGEQMSRRQNADDEAYTKTLGKDEPPSTARPSDGRHVRTRLMTPQEVESAKRQRQSRRSE